MKEWIQINRERSEDYRLDQEILKISIAGWIRKEGFVSHAS